MDPVNGRETLAELRALEAKVQAFRDLMDERDRRYTEGKENDQRAVSAALAANEKLTNAAFAASKEAIVKAETNQTTYNATHNDLTRKMDDQYREMLPRQEATARFQSMDEKIADLRESRSKVSGQDHQSAIARVDVAKWVGWLLAGLGIAWAVFKPT